MIFPPKLPFIGGFQWMSWDFSLPWGHGSGKDGRHWGILRTKALAFLSVGDQRLVAGDPHGDLAVKGWDNVNYENWWQFKIDWRVPGFHRISMDFHVCPLTRILCKTSIPVSPLDFWSGFSIDFPATALHQAMSTESSWFGLHCLAQARATGAWVWMTCLLPMW